MHTTQLSATSSLLLQPDEYVYQILAVGSYLVAILSDDSLHLVDAAALREIPTGQVSKVHAGVTTLRTPTKSSDTVVTAGRDASVKTWDFRSGTQTISFQDVDSNAPYLSLDCNDSAVAAGSELTNHQAAVSIWDYRNPTKPVRKYVESHSDDVTDLAFHPSISNILLSGSMDSLINIYDTNVADEDDTLIRIINHGSSVHHASFLSNDTFFGLSHDEIFSVYHFDPTQQQHSDEDNCSSSLALGDLREALHCEYVVDVVNERSGDSAIIAAGSCSNQYLDLIPLNYTAGAAAAKLDETKSIRLQGAHGSDVVRSFCFANAEAVAETVFTAGEDGCVKAWRVDQAWDPTKDTATIKTNDDEDREDKADDRMELSTSNRKNKRFKPY